MAELPLNRDSRIHVDPKTGKVTHFLGYAMAMHIYTVTRLKPGEPIPDGILSATGKGDVPGQRKHLTADAMLIGYFEKHVDKRRRNVDPNKRYVVPTPMAYEAAENFVIIGRRPPKPVSLMKAKIDQKIKEQRRAMKSTRRRTG